MDFLDPKKKKQQKIKLAIGHTLMVLVVAFGTFILVLLAYGFDLNRKSGEIIQNGLVYIDSAPDNATLKINGQEHSSKTNTRVSLPEGKYTVEISKESYRTWKRSFSLDGGVVERFTYPALYLSDLKPQELQTFDNSVTFSTESPDRRWIVLGQKNSISQFTVYDLRTRQNELPTNEVINLPTNLLTAADGDHLIKLVEWSTDNQNVLVSHTWTGGSEFAVINIDNPAKSFNVNQTIGQNPSETYLFDKKVDQLYIYDAPSKLLQRINIKTKQTTEISRNIISFKPHGEDKLLLAVGSADPKKVDIILKEKDKNYKIREIETSAKIPLDIAKVGDAWYLVIGASSEKKTYIYKNPIDFIGGNNDPEKVALLALGSKGPIDQVAFSQNVRFVMSQSGQHFNVYDIETKRRYSYDMKQPFDAGSKIVWMDGHRLTTHSEGKVLVFDYDGTNPQSLVSGDVSLLTMYDRDYTELYNISPSINTPGKIGFFSTQLRLEEDK
ncbi:PEGA domain-containing protein [Candidatus Saccharibacteria bacterium]|nr:PEGA domain-containing protein [Candidatus Saccharibacteria bacterium]